MSTTTVPTPPAGPSGPPGAPPRRGPSAAGWVLVAVGGVLALATVASATGNLVSAVSRDDASGGEVFRGVSRVDVVNDCAGDVDVRTAAGAGGSGTSTGTVEVSWRDRSSLRAPEHRQELRGGTLRVEVDCPLFVLGWSPSSDLALTLPAGVPTSVRAGSGDLTASGLAAPAQLRTGSGDVEVDGTRGDLDLRTGSGAVRVRDAEGELRAQTGSGDVELADVSAERVEVRTGSGDVELGALRVPRAVSARTGSGDIDLELPGRGTAYAVDADTGSGEISIGVPDDPSAPRDLLLRAGSGDITVVPVG